MNYEPLKKVVEALRLLRAFRAEGTARIVADSLTARV
jgi:hypothetical protein